MPPNASINADMFRPPINRAMRVLDRSYFRKTVPIYAVRVPDVREIVKLKAKLGHDVLKLERMQNVQKIKDKRGLPGKLLLLRPEVRREDPSTWSAKLAEMVKARYITLVPFDLKLGYDYWNYHDIMSSILPEENLDDYPTGFSIVGHVAHLNLREAYMPYKHLIASVLLDKNPQVRTVINKIDDVGKENVFRTFNYELLAGDDNLNVEISEENCTFRFDYSKVYWNSRLNTEHHRLVELFEPGQAVCDVMAGVGPFAVPAGKKGCWVWANDLNPDSFESLKDAVERNKVSKFVHSFNKDGYGFIRDATASLLTETFTADVTPRQPRHERRQKAEQKTVTAPKIFSHYILNLPASALTFLSAFIGIFASHANLLTAEPEIVLPMINVYCFSTKSVDNGKEEKEICEEISIQIGHGMKPGEAGEVDEVGIWDVRDVAPLKRMFCASFRLPREVAFRGS